jgi:hypothetical protein
MRAETLGGVGHNPGGITMRGQSNIFLVFATILFSATVSGVASAEDLFYTTSGVGKEIYAIKVSGGAISTENVGKTGDTCISLAQSKSGTIYSMCGPLFEAQKLSTIDPKTGGAKPFGVSIPKLAVMAMDFAPDGILYAVGGCNADAKNECTSGSDPNYNSLYKVDVQTGSFTRIGSTGASEFFMDLAFDREGNLFGVTSTVNPSMVPAILYRIELGTGKATKIANLVGSNSVMGLDFGRDGKLYATDFTQNPGLYIVDSKTGLETAIAPLPFGLSSNLKLVNLH